MFQFDDAPARRCLPAHFETCRMPSVASSRMQPTCRVHDAARTVRFFGKRSGARPLGYDEKSWYKGASSFPTKSRVSAALPTTGVFARFLR
jgi:hypothetical protein